MNKRAVALILTYLVVAVLTILSLAFFSRTISESRVSGRYVDSTKAFWLAEAGIAEVLSQLRGGAGSGTWTASLTEGSYSVTATASGGNFIVNSHGRVPTVAPFRAQREVEAIMSDATPDDFYDYAIYSAGDIDFNGEAYDVNGSIIYDDEGILTPDPPTHVSGTWTQRDISPLGRFDFEDSREIADGQGNIYDDARLKEVQKGNDSFPGSFWYTEPTDPEDPTTGVPNIVYVETDLQLNGNIGTIGGFYMVVGDVITNPDDTEDATINGVGVIDGVIYTRGEFRINGGAGNLNIDGGVWAGEEARLNGNAHVAYNEYYMKAIEGLPIGMEVRIISWRDKQSPFRLQ